jgi:hypothetical protein
MPRISPVLASAIALVMTGLAPGLAQAASDFVEAPNPTASAAVDFRISIPSVLFLQVGTGTFQADNATIDAIQFNLTSAQASDSGTPIAATATSGDLGNGGVSVRVFGNNGTVTLNSTATALTNGTDTIPWTEIATEVISFTLGSKTQTIPHGAFTSAGALAAPVELETNPGGKVTNLRSTWRYSYANTEERAPGLYQGRVTYTAVMP